MSTTYPVSGSYGSILQAYFGTLDAQDKQNLWNSFLQQEGLSTNPTSPAQVGDFLNFIQGTAETQSLALSPDEVAKRQIMVQTFQSVLSMLNTLQNTVAVQSQSLLYLSKLQQEDTLQLAQVPIYTATPNSTWSPSTDPSQFTFGYDNISVTDISNYLASQQLSNPGTPPTFSLETPGITSVATSVVPGVDGGIVVNQGDSVNLQYTFTTNSNIPQVQINVVDTTTGQQALIGTYTGTTTPNNQTAWSNAFSSVIMQALNTPITQVYQGSVGNTSVQMLSTYSSNYPNYPYTQTTVIVNLSANDYTYQATAGDGSGFTPGIVGSWHGTTSSTVLTTTFTNADDVNQTSAPGPSYNAQNMQFGAPTIPWEYSVSGLPNPITYSYGSGSMANTITGISSVNSQLEQAVTDQQQKIGEKNTQLQEYIQTITANRQVAQNQATTQQNSLNNVQQNVTNQNNLLTTIIQTMQGLVTSIFK